MDELYLPILDKLICFEIFNYENVRRKYIAFLHIMLLNLDALFHEFYFTSFFDT